MKPELKYGLLCGVTGFCWTLGEYLAGFHNQLISWHPLTSMLSVLIPVFFLSLAIREKKKMSGGILTLNQGLKTGSIISLISGMLASAGTFIYYKVINPGWQTFMVEYRREQLIKLSATAEQVEFGVKQAQAYFSLQSYLMQSFMGTIVTGLIISLISTLILKKNPTVQNVGE